MLTGNVYMPVLILLLWVLFVQIYSKWAQMQGVDIVLSLVGSFPSTKQSIYLNLTGNYTEMTINVYLLSLMVIKSIAYNERSNLSM